MINTSWAPALAFFFQKHRKPESRELLHLRHMPQLMMPFVMRLFFFVRGSIARTTAFDAHQSPSLSTRRVRGPSTRSPVVPPTSSHLDPYTWFCGFEGFYCGCFIGKSPDLGTTCHISLQGFLVTANADHLARFVPKNIYHTIRAILRHPCGHPLPWVSLKRRSWSFTAFSSKGGCFSFQR